MSENTLRECKKKLHQCWMRLRDKFKSGFNCSIKREAVLIVIVKGLRVVGLRQRKFIHSFFACICRTFNFVQLYTRLLKSQLCTETRAVTTVLCALCTCTLPCIPCALLSQVKMTLS